MKMCLLSTLLATFSMLALVTTAWASSSPVSPKPQGDQERVTGMILAADRLPIEKVWGVLLQIEDLDLAEDRLLAAYKKAAARSGPVGKLLVARGMLDLDSDGIHSKPAVLLVSPLLAASQPLAIRLTAARLLGDRALGRGALLISRKALESIVKDDTEDQRLRIMSAKSLRGIGTREQVDLSRKTMLEFLKSTDRNLRIAGALALAEIGDKFNARPMLEEIENEPTANGRLARAHLKFYRREREFESLERKLLRQLDEDPDKRNKRNGGRLEFLDGILTLVKRYHMAGKDLDEGYLLEQAAKGMLKSMDRFSSYLTSDEYKRFSFDLGRLYGGIGAYVRIDNGQFMITRPIYSGPAYREGLMSGDRILKVDGWETKDREVDEIIRRLKGHKGTQVTISVWRAGWPEPRDFTLTREEIRVPSVNALLLPGKIGYVELITFGAGTGKELRTVLGDFKKRGAEAIILDLRNNTGGYLSQAQAVADLFLPKNKLIVSTKTSINRDEKLFSRNEPLIGDMPLIVLINRNSASASEIVSGALQDHKRAIILGEQSYGKGSVQSLIKVPGKPGDRYNDENDNGRWDEGERYKDDNRNGKYDPGARVRITISYYFLPSGRSLHRRMDKDGSLENTDYGVIPDIKVPGTRLKTRDLWKNAAIADLLSAKTLHKYVEKHLNNKTKELFLKLADGDGGKTDQYPDFEAFYASLDTPLSKDDIRKWTRVAVREKVSDFRGKTWPGGRLTGDYQEDVQLQAAIQTALEKLNRKRSDFEEFKGIWKYRPEKKSEKVGKSKIETKK